MANEKPTNTNQNYSSKGDKYRGKDGSWYATLPRKKAGWSHILELHEATKK
jgi:hypothetical protein